MALPGPLPYDVVDRWVQDQLSRAPEHLSTEQRRVIKSALREGESTERPGQGAPAERRAG